jgi:hypothetical protein
MLVRQALQELCLESLETSPDSIVATDKRSAAENVETRSYHVLYARHVDVAARHHVAEGDGRSLQPAGEEDGPGEAEDQRRGEGGTLGEGQQSRGEGRAERDFDLDQGLPRRPERRRGMLAEVAG